MKHQLVYSTLFLSFCLLLNSTLFAQSNTFDSNYIRKFAKANVIEIYPDIYSTHFNFTERGIRKNDYSLVANSSVHINTNLNYKWLSLSYSWAMPGTQLDKNVELEYTSLSIKLWLGPMGFHPFYESYNGLLIPARDHKKSYTIFRGIQFTNAGFDYYYFTNTKHFSTSASRSFSANQVKSAGSFLIMATPVWQKINWKNPSEDILPDSLTFKLLSENPEWISFIARAGYTYNFVFQKGKWLITPTVLAGSGVQKEINLSGKKLRLVSNLQGWLNAGYNGPDYYFYLHARWNSLQTNLLIKNMTEVNTNFSITAGYRFNNFRKKILTML